ncbi:MAG: hypothetical protein IJ037_09590 [Clostridia bacterium]|nr:hypothetical protein [Clostridia bacterium]
MKEFWSENSKIISKILLNQFGSTFFGIMLVAASYAAKDQRDWLMLFSSCFATLFYLFLVYNVIWERGGSDRIRVDAGRAQKKPLTGLWISLCANIPNILIALVILIAHPFKHDLAWAGTLDTVGRALALLWEGMYAGVVAYFSPRNPIIHLLVIFPAILVTAGGYILGLHNVRLLSAFELKQPKNAQNTDAKKDPKKNGSIKK